MYEYIVLNLDDEAIENISTMMIYGIEDEESTPIDIGGGGDDSTTNVEQNRNESTRGNVMLDKITPATARTSINGSSTRTTVPVTPADKQNKNGDADGAIGGDRSSNSAELEGDVVGQVEQWVLEPAAQGMLYKCRITRDRKGMDRGLFPLYYLHLEREYGKKIFLLAGKSVS